MEIEIKAYLKDIELSINEIKSFFPDKKDFASFQNDRKTRRAIEKNIEIIGEALNRVLKLRPDIEITNAKNSGYA